MINAIQAFGVIMKKKTVLILTIILIALVASAVLAGCNKSVTVTFELPVDASTGLDGKNIYTTITQDKDTQLEFPAKPISDIQGLEFDGWYDSAGNRVEELTLTKDVTLYGKWKKVEHTITYDLQGGGAMLPNEVNPSKYAAMDGVESFYSPVCTMNGYQFAGWYDKDGKQWTSVLPYTNIDLELIAEWQPVTYKISYYNASGLSVANDNPYTYNITQEVQFKDIAKKGYVFLGWHDSDEGGNKVESIAKGTTGDIKLYARWQIITYSISYDLNGGRYDGEVNNPTTYDVETEVIIEKPVRDNYTFTGWKDLVSGEVYYDSIKEITGDKQLVAQWTPTEYSLIFDLGEGGYYKEGESNPDSYNAFESVTFVNPVKDGYTFGGWKDYETGEIVTGIPEGESRERAFVAVWIEA